MADYIIEESAPSNNRVSGWAYSTVPAGNNAAGTQWRTVAVQLVAKRSGSTAAKAQVLPSTVSQADLDAGSKYEWPFSIEVDANASNAEKQSAFETELLARESELIAELQNELRFWGFEGVA